MTAFRQAIGLRAGFILARVSLSRALMNAGRNEEARKELLEAVTVSPNHPQPRLLLSQLYFRMGKEDMAAQEKQLSMRLRQADRTTTEGQQGRPFID